jgi:hypothetical protein
VSVEDEPRLCAFRQCRAALPVQTGRGNRPRYCQDGRSWGPNELSCKTAEAAFVAVESLADSALTAVALDALGERLAAARAPLADLLDAVDVVGRQVREETAGALVERDLARETAAADRGARERAEAECARHLEAAAEAVERAGAAERAREKAEGAATAAVREQLRAEGGLEALADRVRRAEELAEAAAGQVAELRDRLSTQQAAARAADAALAEERAGNQELVESHRAELAAREAALAALRAEHDTAVAQLRADHEAADERRRVDHEAAMARERADAERALDRRRADAATAAEQLAERHDTALDRLRTDHAAALAAAFAEHARQVADLHRQLGAADHEIGTLRAALG